MRRGVIDHVDLFTVRSSADRIALGTVLTAGHTEWNAAFADDRRSLMITTWIVVGLLAVSVIATIYDTKKRRGVLEATLPGGTTRAARRTIMREQRAQKRAAHARYVAEHPYLHGGGGGDAGGI
jgi:hypothetical protein